MPRRSNVWNYYTKSSSDEAKCNKCDKTLKCAGSSTSGLSFHIKNVHHVDLSEDAEIEAKRQKPLNFFIVRKSMEEEISKMATIDGFSFKRIANSNFIQESFKKRKGEYDVQPPTCPNTVKNMIISFFEKKKKELAELFKEKYSNGKRFSLTLDEYTSYQNKRYMNINVHAENEHWSLGMIFIIGSFNTANCKKLVNDRLNEFGLDLNRHIMASTTDGASVMVKFGREISPDHQQCLAHGIHLAVLDVLYNKNVTNEEEEDEEGEEAFEFDEDNEEEARQSLSLKDDYFSLISKVRKVCKTFKKSPLKNDILQRFVKSEHGHELQLMIDVKTRWNSLVYMCERFCKLKSCITQALDVCSASDETFSENDWTVLKSLCQTLRPIEIVLTSLCSEDANLLKADKSMMILLNKLAKQNNTLARQMHLSLKQRYESRRVQNTVSLLRYLHDPEAINEDLSEPFNILALGSLKKYCTDVHQRLFHESDYEPPNETSSVHESQDEDEEEDFKKCLHNELTKLESKNLDFKSKSSIFIARNEFSMYEEQKKRSPNLDQLYSALRTIKPTSCEAERAFSSAGLFIVKIRSCLSPATINALCFLKCYFLNKNKNLK